MKTKPASKSRTGQRGYSIIELMIVMGVLVIAVQSYNAFIKNLNVANRDYRKRAFALGKATQMMEELRAVVDVEGVSVDALDAYQDGGGVTTLPIFKYTLTTKQVVTKDSLGNDINDCQTAGASLSGNPVVPNQGYQFVRHVTVQKDLTDATVRKVYVRVFEASVNNGLAAGCSPTASAKDPSYPLAEVFALLRSFGQSSVPAQVMDIYLIALESVPGWWARTSRLSDLMQSTIVAVQARNQGLRIREHWIKRMSYGRDLEYSPEINRDTRADNYNFAKTYIYPGLVHYDNGDDNYYDPDWFKGRINQEGTIKLNENYPIADQYNHAMRFPDELNLYNIQCRIAANNNEAKPEISLRMLLEYMNSGNNAYKNSIVINLHGEMVPVVPLRNYSDPAKDAAYFMVERPAATGLTWTARAFRAVTHPERLRFNSASDDIAFKVYAWDANPSAAIENDIIDNVTLFIPEANTSMLKQVERLEGSSTVPYYWNVKNSTTSPWVTTSGVIHDKTLPVAGSSTFAADDYNNTITGRAGLRIQLWGVSATARSYYGAPHP